MTSTYIACNKIAPFVSLCALPYMTCTCSIISQNICSSKFHVNLSSHEMCLFTYPPCLLILNGGNLVSPLSESTTNHASVCTSNENDFLSNSF